MPAKVLAMNEKTKNLSSVIPKIQPLPTGEPRWVYGNGYRCLAVSDNRGKWRSYATGIELLDFIKVCIVA
jgi:hypothetical protein